MAWSGAVIELNCHFDCPPSRVLTPGRLVAIVGFDEKIKR